MNFRFVREIPAAHINIMPQCVLGDHCQYPGLDLRSGHKCRQCRYIVHVLCAEEDPLAGDTSDNLTCFHCTIPPRIPRPSTNNVNPHPPSEADKHPNFSQTSTAKRGDGPSKQRMSTSKGQPSEKKRKSPPVTSHPKRKVKYSKEFQLEADNSKPDPLLTKAVAFDIDDKLYGSQLYNHFGGKELANQYVVNRNGKRLLLGTVIRTSNNKKKRSKSTIHYDVQWEESNLGETSIDLSVVIDAMALHQSLSASNIGANLRKRKASSRDPFSPVWQESERGQPGSSEDEQTDKENELEVGETMFHSHIVYESLTRHKSPPHDDDANDESCDASDFRWSTGILPPPPD